MSVNGSVNCSDEVIPTDIGVLHSCHLDGNVQRLTERSAVLIICPYSWILVVDSDVTDFSVVDDEWTTTNGDSRAT